MTRITPARQLILEIFEISKKPIDYNQIQKYLDKAQFKTNKTTVYRQLSSMISDNIIREIDLGEGKKRYELNTNHHHHLLCTECRDIKCIDIHDNFNHQSDAILQNYNFIVNGHVLEFFGICHNCQLNTKEQYNA